MQVRSVAHPRARHTLYPKVLTSTSLPDLKPGEPRWNTESFLEEYGDDYGLLDDELLEFYKGYMEESRAEKVPKARKTGKPARTDVNTCMQAIVDMVSMLTGHPIPCLTSRPQVNGCEDRTGQAFIVLSVKTAYSSPATAAVYVSKGLQKFTNQSLNMTPEELLHHAEGFALGGLQGRLEFKVFCTAGPIC